MEYNDLAKFFRRNVAMNVNFANDEFRTIEGMIQAVEPTGLVLQTRNGSEVIELKDIIDVDEIQRPRRRRVIRRYVRVLGGEDNIRQHLADRHGVFVSVLNAVPDEVIFSMHERINHDDLGHKHGERPSYTSVTQREAEEKINKLGEYIETDESDELENDLESV